MRKWAVFFLLFFCIISLTSCFHVRHHGRQGRGFIEGPRVFVPVHESESVPVVMEDFLDQESVEKWDKEDFSKSDVVFDPIEMPKDPELVVPEERVDFPTIPHVLPDVSPLIVEKEPWERFCEYWYDASSYDYSPYYGYDAPSSHDFSAAETPAPNWDADSVFSAHPEQDVWSP